MLCKNQLPRCHWSQVVNHKTNRGSQIAKAQRGGLLGLYCSRVRSHADVAHMGPMTLQENILKSSAIESQSELHMTYQAQRDSRHAQMELESPDFSRCLACSTIFVVRYSYQSVVGRTCAVHGKGWEHMSRFAVCTSSHPA